VIIPVKYGFARGGTVTERLLAGWQKIKRPLFVACIIAASFLVIVMIVGFIVGYLYNWGWTGLGPYTSPSHPKDTDFQRSKTLWDWLSLLIVPGVLSLGAIWFTSRQNHDREIALENQHEVGLQAYIDSMSELLLKENLRRSRPGDEVRNIALVRTVTTFSRLDRDRKGRVLHFLYESKLIMKSDKIVDLNFADLRNANLVQFDKNDADLSGTDLRNANLSGANLSGTNLSRAKLQGANLSKVDLSGANLKDASGVNVKKLEKKAKSLVDAIMPDGSIHL